MQSSASFSASRQGRPRPSNIFPGGRSGSDERPWPSPSFNSSMSLTHSDDVFLDAARPSSSLRRSFSGLPPTPITASIMPSPRSSGDKLPGLTDLFVNDQGILAPLTPLTTPQSNHHDFSPSSMGGGSSSMFRSFSNPIDARRRSLATRSSPPVTGMPTQEGVVGLGIEMEITPKASRTSNAAQAIVRSPVGSTSPPRVCPPAPRIGVLADGAFQDSDFHGGAHPGKRPRLGFHWSRFEAEAELDMARPGSVPMKCEAMVQLQGDLPRVEGLTGLGIDLNPSTRQPTSSGSARAEHRAGTAALSPPNQRHNDHRLNHSGLTPLVRTARLDASSGTPTKSTGPTANAAPEKRVVSPKSPSTRVKSKKSPGQLTFRAKYQVQTKEQRANASRELSQTPIKSKPMYRLDNGSAKKQPKGHSTVPGESPWGVFGAKDEWKPLAPPNIAKSGGQLRKTHGDAVPRHLADLQDKENSSPAKRTSMDVDLCSSPTKRHRSALTANSSMKENVMNARARSGEASPQKRNRAPLSALSSSPRKQFVGLR